MLPSTRYSHREDPIDAYLAIVSLRVVREYSDREISAGGLSRILEAGRATGSSQNRQQWMFYVVRTPAVLDELAGAVFAPGNIRGCRLAIAVTSISKSAFDPARCVQNMALAAWADGIGSSPNGIKDAGEARRVLGTQEEESIATILSLGYPLHPRLPATGDEVGILRRIERKPLQELVVWVD